MVLLQSQSLLTRKHFAVKKLLLITSVSCLLVSLNVILKARTLRIKYILKWVPNGQWPIDPFTIWKEGRLEFVESNCRFTNCFLTRNRYKFGFDTSNFDAIIFNGKSLKLVKEPDLPTSRWYHQKFIFLNTESSDNQPICNSLYDVYFNWTATYKLDSDISFSYMLVRNMNGDLVGPKNDLAWVKNMSEFNDLKSLQVFKRRTKAVAWFVSHCYTRSMRENYAKNLKYELNKLNLDLDVFGKCGTLTCPKRNRVCDDLFKNTYYFYLAFENSFAEDYITEKVITALLSDVVPILYGGANYSRFLPPGSYIDARKYNPEELASVIAHLIRSPAAYRDFFRWKNHYTYHRPKNICGLCAALNNQRMLEARSVIMDFRRWWNPDFLERCKDGLNWGT